MVADIDFKLFSAGFVVFFATIYVILDDNEEKDDARVSVDTPMIKGI